MVVWYCSSFLFHFFASVALSAFDDYCVVHSRPYHAMLFTRMYIGGARSTCMEYG